MNAIKSLRLTPVLWSVFLTVAALGVVLVVTFQTSAQTDTNACILAIDGSGTFNGSWDDTCLSEKEGSGGGTRYARFYTFTLSGNGTFTATLTSSQDPYLYLLEGNGRNGTIIEENDDADGLGRNSQIPEIDLAPGDYTIEATTYEDAKSGDFTLEVEITEEEITPVPTPTQETSPPDPAPSRAAVISAGANHACSLGYNGEIECQGKDDHQQVSDHPDTNGYTAISVGASHSCALDEDGNVECWGSDEYGQSTPAQGQFVALVSGDNYSCALRANGDVHCWGRFEP